MEYGKVKDMEWEVSSGETEALEAEQQQFNQWLKEADEEKAGDIVWDFEPAFDDDLSMRSNFFTYIGEHIKCVPAYKYVVRFLLLRYQIAIGESNTKELWKYIETPKWSVDTKADINVLRARLARDKGMEAEKFTAEDSKLVLSVLLECLRKEYPEGLVKGAWTTYFYALINKFNAGKLKDMVLALNLDLEVWRLFKTKVLRKREMDFLDKDDLMLYLTLKYAPKCGESNLDAYRKLQSLYSVSKGDNKPAKKKPAETDNKSSMEIGRQILDCLEEEIIPENTGRKAGGSDSHRKTRLRDSYRETLFTEKDAKLEQYFDEIDQLNRAKVRRSCQAVLMEEWDKFFAYVRKLHHFDINDKLRTDKHKDNRDSNEAYCFHDAKYESENYDLDRHKVFRWLYGNNVETQIGGEKGPKRINDLPDSEMVRLAPDVEGYFLDSQEFLNTRIRDNDFYAATFTKDETRQRNLLLTLGFLNFVSEEFGGRENKGITREEYVDRLINFEFEMVDLLQSCGFMTLHSGNAYDAFLKLMLSSDDPMGLFHYIWSLKTNSED